MNKVLWPKKWPSNTPVTVKGQVIIRIFFVPTASIMPSFVEKHLLTGDVSGEEDFFYLVNYCRQHYQRRFWDVR